MARIMNLSLLMWLCILLAATSARRNRRTEHPSNFENEYQTVQNLTNSLTKIVKRFKGKFLSEANLPDLQVVVETIDSSMVDYQGLARNHLDSLRSEYHSARNTYQEVADPVFEWCVSIEDHLHDFIQDLNNPTLSQSDLVIIWNITADAVLIEGIITAFNSFDNMKLLKSKVSRLSTTLDAMLESVQTDFGANGFYFREQHPSEAHCQGEPCVSTITRFFNHILEFYKSYPNYFSGPLFQKFNSLGLRGVIDKHRRPSYKDQLDTVRFFFKVLNDKIQKADIINGQVIEDLKKEYFLKSPTQLRSKNIGLISRNRDHLLHLAPKFRALRKACVDNKSLRDGKSDNPDDPMSAYGTTTTPSTPETQTFPPSKNSIDNSITPHSTVIQPWHLPNDGRYNPMNKNYGIQTKASNVTESQPLNQFGNVTKKLHPISKNTITFLPVTKPFQTINDLTNSLTKVVSKLTSKFEPKVNMRELQVLISTIDRTMVDYQGSAKIHLDPLRNDYKSAGLTYQQVVDPVFEWCVSIEDPLHDFIQDLDDPSLEQSDLNIIWYNTADAVLIKGIKTAINSLEKMNLLESEVSSLSTTLDRMLESVQADFGANGFYFREQHPSEAHCQGEPCVSTITRFFNEILEFHKSYPNYFLEPLLQKLNSLGLSGVINKSRRPSYKDQLDTVRSFFEVLNDKIQYAAETNGQVIADLEQDQHSLEKFPQLGTENIASLLSISSHLRHQLVPQFQNLRKACVEYTSLRAPRNIHIDSTSPEPQPSHLSPADPTIRPNPQTGHPPPINNEYQTVENVTNSLTKVVRRFTTEFESESNLEKLQGVLATIDSSMVYYQGPAKIYLDSLRTEYKSARLTYQKVVDPVFLWCVSINSTLHDFINDIDDPKLIQSDSAIIWSNTANAVLIEGIRTASSSLENLHNLKSIIKSLDMTLDQMLLSVETDFNRNTISRFFNNILTFSKTNLTDFLEPFFQKLDLLRLSDVVYERQKPSFQKKLVTVRAFFEVLKDKIKSAAETNSLVSEELEQDQHYLDSLFQQRTKNVESLLSSSPGDTLHLVPKLQDLGKACDDYKSWREPRSFQEGNSTAEQQAPQPTKVKTQPSNSPNDRKDTSISSNGAPTSPSHLPGTQMSYSSNLKPYHPIYSYVTPTFINNEYQTVENVTKSLTKVVRRFTTEFESESNLEKLQGVLATIDSSMVYYQGPAKVYLDSLRTEYSSARLTYQKVVDPVFLWCVSINSTLHDFINDIGDAELIQSDSEIIWSNTANAVLIEGIRTASSTLENLHHLKSIIKRLDMTLDEILLSVETDFGKNTISRFFNNILALSKTNLTDFLEPFFQKLDLLRLSDVLNERREPSFREKLDIVRSFFEVLKDKIKSAAETNSLVSEELEQDQHYLDSLFQQRTKNVESLLSSSPGDTLYLVPKLQDLGKACDDYKIWREPRSFQEDLLTPELQTPHPTKVTTQPLNSPNDRTDTLISSNGAPTLPSYLPGTQLSYSSNLKPYHPIYSYVTPTPINNEYQTVENVTNSLTKVVRRFTTEFESESNLAKLQDVLVTIDSSMLYYEGPAKIYLDSLRTEYSSARLTYQKVVDPVFEWCVSINSTLHDFINDIGDPKLIQSDSEIIWSNTANAVLIEGIRTASSSLENLHNLKSIIKSLDMTLDQMLLSVETDFNRNTISRFFNNILTLSKTNLTDFLEPFFQKLDRLRLSDVVYERREPSFQEKLDIVRSFFEVLKDKIKSAAETNSLVSEELEQDQHYLDSLFQQRTKNVQSLLRSNPRDTLHLVPKMQDLGKACDEYKSWREPRSFQEGNTTPEQQAPHPPKVKTPGVFRHHLKTSNSPNDRTDTSISSNGADSSSSSNLRRYESNSLNSYVTPTRPSYISESQPSSSSNSRSHNSWNPYVTPTRPSYLSETQPSSSSNHRSQMSINPYETFIRPSNLDNTQSWYSSNPNGDISMNPFGTLPR